MGEELGTTVHQNSLYGGGAREFRDRQRETVYMGEELGNYVHQNMGEELGNYVHQNSLVTDCAH